MNTDLQYQPPGATDQLPAPQEDMLPAPQYADGGVGGVGPMDAGAPPPVDALPPGGAPPQAPVPEPPGPPGPPAPEGPLSVPPREAIEADMANRDKVLTARNDFNASGNLPPGMLKPPMQQAGGAPMAQAGAAPAQRFGVQVSGGGVIPAHEVKVVGPTGEAAIQKMVEAGEQKKAAAQQYVRDVTEANTLAQQAAEEQSRSAIAQQAQIEKDQAEFRAKSDQMQREIDSDTRRLADMKSDPGRWWNNQDGLTKAGFLVGGFFSGMLSGMTGQPDKVLQQYNMNVDRDIASQERAWRMAEGSLAAKRSAFGQLVQRYGSPDAARSALQSIKLQQFKAIADQAAAKLGTADAKMKAAEIGQLVDTNTAQLNASTVKYQMAQAVAPKVSFIDRETGLPMTQEQAVKAAESDRDRTAKLEEKRLEAGEGSKAEQAKLREEAREMNTAVSILDDARKNVKGITAGSYAGEKAAHLPAFIPGVEQARKNVSTRDAYNAKVYNILGANWKRVTGGVEPKNADVLHEQAKPYLINPTDSEEVALAKMDALKKWTMQSAPAPTGGQQQAAAPAAPASLKKGL